MKNLFFLLFIISLTFLTGCGNNVKKPENVFLQFNNKQYSENLTLEEGLKIILPYVRKWADDAELQKYITNIVSDQNKFKTNSYSFESIKYKKTLSVTYNFKHPINEATFSGFGHPESWELNNKFNFQETDWPSNINEETLAKITENLTQNKYNKNYLKSEKIIEIAKKEGLKDFILNNKESLVKENNVMLLETSDDINWVVVYAIGEKDSMKYTHSFIAKFNPVTGELIKKSIN